MSPKALVSPAIQLVLSVFTYGRVEKSTRDSEEDPCVDCKGKSKAKTDVEQLGWVWTLRKGSARAAGGSLRRVGDLGSCKCEEAVDGVSFVHFDRIDEKRTNLQEQECTDEFASHGNKVVADIIGHSLEYWRSFGGSHLLCVCRISYASF